MGKKGKHKKKKILKWTLGILVALIILVPVSLYIPWVQNKAKDVATTYVKKKTGKDLSIEKVLIQFPFNISLFNVMLSDSSAQISAKKITAEVNLKSLFKKQLEIENAEIFDGKYQRLSKDNSIILEAGMKNGKLKGTDIDLVTHKFNVQGGKMTGGYLTANYKDLGLSSAFDLKYGDDILSISMNSAFKAKTLTASTNNKFALKASSLLPIIHKAKDVKTFLPIYLNKFGATSFSLPSLPVSLPMLPFNMLPH